jgi:hypothetical protein
MASFKSGRNLYQFGDTLIRRKLSVLAISFLIVVIVVPTYLSFVSSSTGNIRINGISTSVVGQQVPAGGNINLYFGGIAWSSSSFYLFWSQDGLAQVSSGDSVYTPAFSIYDVIDLSTVHHYSQDSSTWTVGNNWVNGSIPTTLTLGNYYVKSVDQIFSSVAVTDTYFSINSVYYNSTLNISPSAGPGGIDIAFAGSRYIPGSTVDISYYDPNFNSWNLLTSTMANGTGQIQAASQVPDLKKSLGSGDCLEATSTISYRSSINGITYCNAVYNEYLRGLKTVGNQTAYGLYGNGTNLVSNVRAMIGDSLTISGKWFHPGIVYVRWDSASVVSTLTSSQWLNANIIGSTATNPDGSFTTSVNIPQNVEAGEHYLAVEDSQLGRVIVKIFVSAASLQLSPAMGPGGATVQFNGFGYPASTSVGLYYLDPSFGTWNYWSSASTDSSGALSMNVEIPDLQKASSSYGSNSTISFRTQIGGVAYSYADYTECGRGITQVGSQITQGLYGNGTNLASSVNVSPGNSLVIAGKWFHPGVIYVRFDGIAVVGTVTSNEWQNAQIIGSSSASSTGAFSTTVTIPSASGGQHFLSVEDSQTRLILIINVLGPVLATPTPTAAPTANPTSTPIPTPNPSLPTPSIDLSCKSTTTVSGFKVEIDGNLTLNGNAVSDNPVLLSYSVTGGTTWQSLTLIRTTANGQFTAVWQPNVNGNYLIKATVDRTSTMNSANRIVNLALTPDAGQNVFTVTSNSTVSQFAFNSTTQELSFIVAGPSGTKGYVDLYIPKTLISDISNLKTYIDGNQIAFNSESQPDAWHISFTYSHSTHTVTMAIGSNVSQVSNPNPTQQWLLYVVAGVAVVAIAGLIVVFKYRAKKD